MNCLTRSLDLLHEKGGWFAARTSVPGQGYDWIGLIGSQTLNRGINNKGAAFCSEWIAQAGGVPNPELYNPGTLRDLNQYLNEVVR